MFFCHGWIFLEKEEQAETEGVFQRDFGGEIGGLRGQVATRRRKL